MNISTSILIRTKNEVKDLPKALDLIRQQSLKPAEIIVVDSGSNDGTVEFIMEQSDVKLIQIPSEKFTYGYSLNIGFKAAEGEVVICLSAHAFPGDRDWLYHLVKHFENPQVAGVYGKQLPQPDAWPPVQRDYLECYRDRPKIQTRVDNYQDHFFSNSNAAIRYQCWEKRPFDETLTYTEDWEWARAMLGLGYQTIYEPEAAVYHSHNEPLLKVYQRQYNQTLALAMLYNTKMTLRGAWETWYRSVVADLEFILKNDRDRRWLLRSPIYRLFWTFGSLRPNLPNALWEPLKKRWQQIAAFRVKKE